MKTPEESDTSVPHAGRFVVALVGTSAGGVEALRLLLSTMPPDPPIALVIVHHVDPTRESAMAEILGRQTDMPVSAAADGLRVEPGQVYVIAPNTRLAVSGGILRTQELEEAHNYDPIDVFARSLAEDQGAASACVILSGTGSDGSKGLRDIKEAGGLVIAQADPRFDGMPRAAIATGLVDDVLPAEEISARLVARAEEIRGGNLASGLAPGDLGRVLGLLRKHTGHDFAHYKKSSVLRRILHRIHALGVRPQVYVERLHVDPQEPHALLASLLIGVTRFFRDPDAFVALAEGAIHQLVQRGPEHAIRVWVPGCSTGQEAYSIAIELREALDAAGSGARATVFATDIDSDALAVARRGHYDEDIAEEVGPERLARFFVRDASGYQVSPQIRDMCMFSVHSVIRDPPFARLDLVSCRNLLIYLSADIQQRLMPLFHYALCSGGYLFLGSSEMGASVTELFEPIDMHHRLFRRREVAARPLLDLPLGRGPGMSASAPEPAPTLSGAGVHRQVERILLESFAPAAAVVDSNGRVIYSSGPTSRYLGLPSGVPTLGLVDLVPRDLRMDLRVALRKCRENGAAVTVEDLPLHLADRTQRIDLVVRPIGARDLGLTLVVFRELGAPEPPRVYSAGASPDTARLEDELIRTQQRLQVATDELGGSNQELRGINEDLNSLNEELQSANEELQTGKEEMQSVNEELETVNAELRDKVEQLDHANADLQNLFRSTRIATIFLDLDLHILRFTPASRELFRVLESDAGRPLADISALFDATNLVEEANEVLASQKVRQREVRSNDGHRWYVMRILPYTTVSGRVDGVVLTFAEVTETKRAQLEAANLAAIVESSQDAILAVRPDGVITSWNAGAAALFGYTRAEAIGCSVSMLAPPGSEALLDGVRAMSPNVAPKPFDTIGVTPDGTRIPVQVTLSPMLGASGELEGVAAILRDARAQRAAEEQKQRAREELEARVRERTAELAQAVADLRREVAERQQADEALRRSEDEYRALFELANIGKARLELGTGRFVRVNARLCENLGYRSEEVVQRTLPSIVDEEERAAVARAITQVSEGELPEYSAEVQMVGRDRVVWMHLSVSPITDASGQRVGLVAMLTDVTDRKRLEEQLVHARKMEAIGLLAGGIAHDFNNLLTAIVGHATVTERRLPPEDPLRAHLQGILSVSERAAALTNQLLAFARRQVVAPRIVDINANLVRIHQLLRRLIGADIELVTLASEAPIVVRIDPTRFEQVIVNLAVNARDAMPDGGTLSIGTEVVELDAAEAARHVGARAGRFAVVEVTDTGMGMSEDELARCFEPFFTTKAQGKGTGLGLSTSYGLVRQAGGFFEVRSAPGEGSTFRMYLPMAAGDAVDGATIGSPSGRVEGGDETILFVDDVTAVLRLGAEELAANGYDVLTASDGMQALAIAEARDAPVDLLVTDIVMPLMSGLELAARMRQRWPGLRVLFISGYTGRDALEGEVGTEPFLAKPYTPAGLARKVREVLDAPVGARSG